MQDTLKEKAIEFLSSMGLNLPHGQKTQFVELCVELGLNPFKREIYAIGYNTKIGEKFNIVIGYEVYLKKAEKTQKCQGWKAWTEGDGEELKAFVEIHRSDYKIPFIHEVELKEYDQGNSIWKQKPKTMLKKVAITQGFRLAFPSEFAGMPYIPEELDSNLIELPESKNIKELEKALAPLGITLAIDTNDVATAQGKTFGNDKILKSLGFIFSEGRWERKNTKPFEESQSKVVVPQVQLLSHKTLQDFSSTEGFKSHIEKMGLAIEYIMNNDIRWAKISGPMNKESTDFLEGLGAVKRGENLYALNATILKPSGDMSLIKDMVKETLF